MKKILYYPYNLYLKWYYRNNKRIGFDNSRSVSNPWNILTFYFVFLTIFTITLSLVVGIGLIIKDIIIT